MSSLRPLLARYLHTTSHVSCCVAENAPNLEFAILFFLLGKVGRRMAFDFGKLVEE